MSNSTKNPARIVGITAVVVIAGGALAYALIGKKADVATGSATAVSQSVSSATTTAASSSTAYRDGTYTATGSYVSPGGTEKIGVTLTLQGGVITAASVNPEPVSEQGVQFQNIFAQNFKQYVIGKDISSVHLTTVSGSSLTPEGFNNALAAIETQAKA